MSETTHVKASQKEHIAPVSSSSSARHISRSSNSNYLYFLGTPRRSRSVTQTIKMFHHLGDRTFTFYVCCRTKVCAKQRVYSIINSGSMEGQEGVNVV